MIKYFYGRFMNSDHIICTAEIFRVTDYGPHLRLHFKNGATMDISNFTLEQLADQVFEQAGLSDCIREQDG